ncbi:ABC transporter permease subunit [Streptomyces sp. 3MP-14]|uniref:ABC transporter permease subunit n=2 Tax=Streptomyces TaxID=1883 RepID=A0A5N6AF56_9ACTN|nr:ABC transporter permease subunit [Streptomyces mimosae]KAB8177234.1 ABC transporter permease subunit [Streptomyces sp. 3MP-14]
MFPLYWTFVMASSDNSVLSETTPPLVPGGHLFDNISRVFDSVDFWVAIRNSLIISSAVALSNVLFSSLAGFAFAKLRFPGRDALMVVVIATLMVPTQLGIVPLYMLMSDIGLYGSLWAVILPGMVSAFGVFWMRQAIDEGIPDELVEAARVDGAGLFLIWWKVIVPGVRNTASVLGLFVFMTAWNDFFWPLVVLPADNGTVQTALNQLAAGYYTDYALMLSGAVLAVIPLLILFALLARRVIAGVMSGAVKG